MVAGELFLSFVPDAGQRAWRTVMRARLQLVCEKVQLQNQVESLLEGVMLTHNCDTTVP